MSRYYPADLTRQGSVEIRLHAHAKRRRGARAHYIDCAAACGMYLAPGNAGTPMSERTWYRASAWRR